MIKKLVLTNNKGDALDLINVFKIQKEQLAFEWVSDDNFSPQTNKVVYSKSSTVPIRKLPTISSRIKLDVWEKIRHFFVREYEYLKIEYQNDIGTYEFFVDDMPSFKYLDSVRKDTVYLELSFHQVSNLFTPTKYHKSWKNDEEGLNGTYPWTYGESVYAQASPTTEKNLLTVENIGDKPSPFVLNVISGGENLQIELYNNGVLKNTARLYGNYIKNVVFDMYHQTVTYLGVDVTDKLDTDHQNFFNLPFGKSTINVINAKEYEVIVMNERLTP